jgi:hypothetical protein
MRRKYSVLESVFAGNTRQLSLHEAREAARVDSSSLKNPKTEDPLPESSTAEAPCSIRNSLASLIAG